MAVCRLVWEYPPANRITYGLGPAFYHLSKEQAKQGIEVHVISLAKGEPPEEVIDGVHVHRVGLPYNLRATKRLLDLHRDYRFDLIHAHGTCGIIYPAFRRAVRRPLIVHTHGTTLGMMRHKFRPPPVISLRDFSRSLIREYISVIRQQAYWRAADLLIAVSQALRDEIESLYHINKSKIRVVYNGVDTSIFRHVDADNIKRKYHLEGKRVILYVGHFGFRKGILYLYRALPSILKEERDSVLVCVGGTPRWLGTTLYWRVLREAISKYDLEGKVILLGQVPHYVLPGFYSMSDVFVLPSLYEALGKVVLEAMACEVPVVASRVGGVTEIVDSGKSGWLVQPKNTGQLASAILSILQDRDLQKRMGTKGRSIVEENFTWTKSAQELLRVYHEVIS